MVTVAKQKIKGEEELILFTCFTMATTYDEDGTERLYYTSELKGVTRQLIKAKVPDFLVSKESKELDISYRRDIWRDNPTRRDVVHLTEQVENNKAYYLGRAAKLLQQHQEESKPKEAKSDRNEPDQRHQVGGYGSYQVPGYHVSTPAPRNKQPAPSKEQPAPSKMKIAGEKIDDDDKLVLFTCFAVATTRDEDGTERLYNTTELKGVVKQFVKPLKSDFHEWLASQSAKKLNIDPLRKKWRDPTTGPEVESMRQTVEKYKPYYLDCAAKLLQQYHQEEKPNQVELIVNDGAFDQPAPSKIQPAPSKIQPAPSNIQPATRTKQPAPSNIQSVPSNIQSVPSNKPDRRHQVGGYGSSEVPGYPVSTPHGQPRTQDSTVTFPSQRSAFSDQYRGLPAPTHESVTSTLGGINLSATSPPHSQLGYQYERSGGASLQNPTRQYSYTNPFMGAERSEDPSLTSYTNRDTSTYPQPPPPQQSSYSQGSGRRTESWREWSPAELDAFNRGAASEEPSTSSGKSKSPAFHEERREREVEHERRDPSGKSRGKESGGSSKQKEDKSKESKSKPESGDGSKHKDSKGKDSKGKDSKGKDDTKGDRRRREGERK